MISIKFPGANLEIGKNQPEYTVLHAMSVPGPEGELIMCFELTDEEIEKIKETKKIYYSRWTFGHQQQCENCKQVMITAFHPMRLFTDLSDGIELRQG